MSRLCSTSNICRTCYTEPIILKDLRILDSKPCIAKLNMWVKPNKYFIVWKAAMEMEFVINFKSPDA